MHDPYHLARFLTAQAGMYDKAHRELAEGRKRTHWMWFIFPQIQGLGHSPQAKLYAIGGLAEAEAYLTHPVLGERLRECVALVNRAHPTPLGTILGYPDDLKFYSSVTLFDQVEPRTIFEQALRLWFGGLGDSGTLARL